MRWRFLTMMAAVAWVAGAATVLADDGGDDSSLNLPTAISPETLAKTSARGEASAAADAAVDEDGLHASASATASIDQPISVNGPVTTGNIGPLGAESTSQVSTGLGNIQQGVSATAISF